MGNSAWPRPGRVGKASAAKDSRARDSVESRIAGPSPVVEAWDDLPDAVRQGILAMVKATRKQQ